MLPPVPPLYVEGLTHNEYFGNNVANDTDEMLSKIIALAQASHEPRNSLDSWDGGSASGNFHGDFNYSGEKVSCLEANVEAVDMQEHHVNFKEERLVENLRWVGVSSKELEKVVIFYNVKCKIFYVLIYMLSNISICLIYSTNFRASLKNTQR